MNGIEKALLKMMQDGDPQMMELFETYVQNMGHTKKEASVIVESILASEKSVLTEGLSDLAKFRREE